MGPGGYGGLSLFYAVVLKCGPGPFALAQATRLASALISSSNKGCKLSVTGLHQYSAGLEGSHHTHKLVLASDRHMYKQQRQEREGRRDEGGWREGKGLHVLPIDL